MDDQREEVYERIPWETLEEKGRDRQWLVLGIAGAVVAGVIGYSYVANRPMPPPPAATAPPASFAAPAPPPGPTDPAPVVPQPVPTAPEAVSEADLYAVDPERLLDEAAAHARLFVREFLAVDGSDPDRLVLRNLLPADVPLPTQPEGLLVFVEWVDTVGVEKIDVSTFKVTTIARYMVSEGGGGYVRVDPEMFVVEVSVVGGEPVVRSAPRIGPATVSASPPLGLVSLPEITAQTVASTYPGSEIVGASSQVDGSWYVVVLVEGPGGVLRPELVEIAP